MQKLLALIIISGILSFSMAAWESVGPYGGYLRTTAISPSNDNFIYTTTNSNPCIILKSTNGGNSWNKKGSIANSVYSLAVDPTNPDIVYAGSYRVVYKSTNGGSSWTSHSVSGSYSYLYGLAVHSNTPSTVFASGTIYTGSQYVMGFFKSTNGGTSWTNLELTADRGYSYSLTTDPSNPNTIYVGGYSYNSGYFPKVYKSTNGGDNFNDASSGISLGNYVYALAVHPSNPNTAYAVTFYGYIYRTTNGGTSWSEVHSGSILSSLATTPANPNVVYAGADTVIYKSTNSGASWFETGSGFGGRYKAYRGLAASLTSASTVYTIDAKGFFKTTNGGANWFDSNLGINIATINCISVAPSSPSTIYTDVDNTGVYKTTNSGTDWTLLPEFLSCGNICAIAIHNTTANTVFALEGSG